MGHILCVAAYFVLFEKKRKQHQHASIMHNPPHIDVAFVVTLVVAGVERDIFGNQQSQMSCSGAANSTCPGGGEHSHFQFCKSHLWLEKHYSLSKCQQTIEVIT